MIAPWLVDRVAPEPLEENGSPGNDEGAPPETRRGITRPTRPLLPTCEYARGKAWAFAADNERQRNPQDQARREATMYLP